MNDSGLLLVLLTGLAVSGLVDLVRNSTLLVYLACAWDVKVDTPEEVWTYMIAQSGAIKLLGTVIACPRCLAAQSCLVLSFLLFPGVFPTMSHVVAAVLAAYCVSRMCAGSTER